MNIDMNLMIGGYYTVTREIGRGSFGIIYEGKHRSNDLARGKKENEVYAVKLVTLHKNP